MERPPLSEAQLYDILLKQEAELRPKAERMWEMVKIAPERWDDPSYASGRVSFWAVGLIGDWVLFWNEFESEFSWSKFETYGQIGSFSFGPTELTHCMEQLIRQVDGEQAYSS
ncbi:hypothetical protein [Pelagibius sp.]|uniref:hypothetical protein n=1 Tax=Pelagibius sp. TaxID=1931238 RepID=UPI00262ABD92|nr:hypothetical protein [Pelagibius sp.]